MSQTSGGGTPWGSGGSLGVPGLPGNQGWPRGGVTHPHRRALHANINLREVSAPCCVSFPSCVHLHNLYMVSFSLKSKLFILVVYYQILGQTKIKDRVQKPYLHELPSPGAEPKFVLTGPVWYSLNMTNIAIDRLAGDSACKWDVPMCIKWGIRKREPGRTWINQTGVPNVKLFSELHFVLPSTYSNVSLALCLSLIQGW